MIKNQIQVSMSDNTGHKLVKIEDSIDPHQDSNISFTTYIDISIWTILKCGARDYPKTPALIWCAFDKIMAAFLHDVNFVNFPRKLASILIWTTADRETEKTGSGSNFTMRNSVK